MKKRFLVLAMVAILLIGLAACGGDPVATSAPTTAAPPSEAAPTSAAPTDAPVTSEAVTSDAVTSEAVTSDAPTSEAPADADADASSAAGADGLVPITAGMLEGPVLITSVGQSADVSIVKTLLDRAEIDLTQDNVAEAADLDGAAYKTLVLAVGGSSKGLGAAGIDENQELTRVTDLIAAAKAAGIKILSIHIGGSARRGTLSDKFIPDAFEAADAAIVLTEGDGDSLMRNILVAGSIPAVYVEQQIETVEPITTLFTAA